MEKLDKLLKSLESLDDPVVEHEDDSMEMAGWPTEIWMTFGREYNIKECLDDLQNFWMTLWDYCMTGAGQRVLLLIYVSTYMQIAEAAF